MSIDTAIEEIKALAEWDQAQKVKKNMRDEAEEDYKALTRAALYLEMNGKSEQADRVRRLAEQKYRAAKL